ncbi:hypothetical protein ACIP5Y_40655 [Nocardia sp. NPDC088792]|uniref:hypothetical protein n=1 Tax=Nocardia sp. NPDC088792 TaxID=3364332 RepID=UPI003827B737
MALIVIGLALTACGKSSTPSPPPKTVPDIPDTSVWSADEGIDLFSRGAELIRATLEAGGNATYTGVDNAAYPGYARAVADLTKQVENARQPILGVRQYVSRQPVNPDWKERPMTTYLHITGYTATDTKVSAIVCGYSVLPEQLPQEDDRFQGGGIRIELDNTTSQPGLPGIANRDPGHHDPRAQLPPRWDVFGTWKVTTIKAPVGNDQYAAECLPWLQEQFPTFTKDPNYNVLNAPPGYVAPHHPVTPQFPEWIGPSDRG